MGFFSGIRRRIKKIIPKEVRPAIPFIAAALPFTAPAGLGALGAKSATGSFLRASLAKGISDDEADLQDIFRTGAIAAAPQAISGGLGKFGEAFGSASIADPAMAGEFTRKKGILEALANKAADASASGLLNPELKYGNLMNTAKTVAGQTTTDFGIQQAELNEKALEEYNKDLLSKGIRDKASRRNAIFNIFMGAGYDGDEVNVMLDKYGYADGGTVGRRMRGSPAMTEAMKGFFKRMDDSVMVPPKKPVDSDDDEIEITDDEELEIIETVDKDGKKRKKTKITRKDDLMDNLGTAMSGIETAYGRPFGNMDPVPMLRFAEGGDVDEVMEFDEEIITPEYLMREEGVPIQEQVSAPSGMDDLNQLSLMLFKRPLGELTDDEIEMLQDFASQQALKPGLIDEYRNYKYEMEEQGRTPMSPRDYFRMEFGAARMGVAKGGPIKKKKVMSIATGKLKDYPGIKKILEMNKKGKKRFSKAEGGLMNLAGNEMDLRGGGFVPMGKKEKADDVPARLSKNEFVMTADAVRAAGGGSVQKGADLMYDTMKKLEAQS